MSDSSHSDTPTPRFGLCLSGGGFRATFFHLGVVKLLVDANLLTGVQDVCSVSGGSILGASMAVHWDEYVQSSKDEAAFYRASLPLVRLARSDLRGRIVRRWLTLGILPAFRRTRVLTRYYSSRLLSESELGRLPSPVPRFYFLATSLTTGRSVSFSREGYNDGLVLHRTSELPLGLAVAASSAFPPLFPPVAVSRKALGAKLEQFPLGCEHLTDGGVFDNLGVAKMNELQHARPTDKETITLASNASATFDWVQSDRGFATTVARTIRTTEVLMTRAATLEAELQATAAGRFIEVSLQDMVTPSDLDGLENLNGYRLQDETVQQLVGRIRTDLDAFSLPEICSLVRHGYEVGLKQLHRADLISPDFKPMDPCLVPYPETIWPQNSEMIPHLRTIRGLQDLTNGLSRLPDVMEEVENASAIFLGKPSPTRPPKTDDIEKVRQLREQLRGSSRRALGLWHTGDWLCWLLGATIVGLAWVVGARIFGFL